MGLVACDRSPTLRLRVMHSRNDLTYNLLWAQNATAEPVCSAFDNVTGREALRALGNSPDVELESLPPIVAMGGSLAAEWVEFDPDWLPIGKSR